MEYIPEEREQVSAVELLAQVVAVVMDTSLTADEMRERVRHILQGA